MSTFTLSDSSSASSGARELSLARQTSLLKIVSKIRQSLDFVEVGQTAVHEARKLLDADRVVVYRFEPDWSGKFLFESADAQWTSLVEAQHENLLISKNVSRCSAQKMAQPQTVDTHLQVSQGGAFVRGEIFRVCPDIYEAGFSDCYIETLESYQARSYAIVAIYIDNVLWGLLAAFQNEGPRQWQQDEVQLLVQIAEQLGIALKQSEYVHTIQAQTVKLHQTLEDLQRSQAQLIHSEKMAALGQLVAGVAHEINNPLGAIQTSAANNRGALLAAFSELPDLHRRLNDREQDCFFKLVDKAKENRLFIASSEARAIKRAIIAELKIENIENPRILAELLIDMGVHQDLAFILPLLKGKQAEWALTLAYNLTRSFANNQSILDAVDRSSKIVFSLKSYARFDHTGKKSTVKIIDSLNTVLEIYRNQLKYNIKVIQEYPKDDEIILLGYPDELIQVWTNLIHNAIQAMEMGGTLTISARREQEGIEIKISDTGEGIAPEVQKNMFDAFFTTKPVGKGSGLGLNISQKIIKKHQGKIWVKSEPGQTQFFVWLPVQFD